MQGTFEMQASSCFFQWHQPEANITKHTFVEKAENPPASADEMFLILSIEFDLNALLWTRLHTKKLELYLHDIQEFVTLFSTYITVKF